MNCQIKCEEPEMLEIQRTIMTALTTEDNAPVSAIGEIDVFHSNIKIEMINGDKLHYYYNTPDWGVTEEHYIDINGTRRYLGYQDDDLKNGIMWAYRSAKELTPC